MTLKRLTNNMFDGSRTLNLIRSIIFMTGWLKSWPEAIRKRLVHILTPRRSCATSARTATAKCASSHSRAILIATPSSLLSSIAFILLVIAVACPAHAQSHAKRTKKPPAKTSSSSPNKKTATSTKKGIPSTPAAVAGEKQLAQLARTLRDHPNATSYAVLSAYATKNTKNELGADAALALGYYDLTRDKPDLAIGWLRKAGGDKDLREYVQYWQSQASLALGQKDEGLEQLL